MRRVEPLTEDTRISDATELPQSRRHPRLPVVDGKRRVLGVVSRDDLETWLREARQSAAEPSGQGGAAMGIDHPNRHVVSSTPV